MTGLHAALAELAAEWADRTPRSDAPRDRRECATVLRALLAEHEPSGQVDHEQPYRDLRAAIKTLASDMHRGWKHVRDGADAAFLIAKMLDDLASSAPTTASEGAHRCDTCEDTGRVAWMSESILAARLAEVTAERDEAKAERDEARAVRAWVGERGDDHLDRVLRKTTHCDCGGWDQVFELQTESPRPLFGGIRPWKYAGITLKGQSNHARACPKSWRNSPDEKLAHTEARADALAEQVAAIQALHRPDGGIDGPGAMCVSCTADFGTPAEDPTPWPCPTAVVLADPGSALAARDTKVAAQARAELLAKVQDVYDLQCPVRPSEDYTHPAARVAHKWWQTVLGGLLDRERAAGGEVEQP